MSAAPAALALLPNTCAVVGADVAQKLLALCDNQLGRLAEMPANTLRHLGRDEVIAPAAGGSSSSANRDRALHAGVIMEAPLLAAVARDSCRKAVEKLANKAHLAVVVDASDSHPDGSFGAKVAAELALVFEKMDARVAITEVKALPVPKQTVAKVRSGEKEKRLNAKFEPTVLEKMSRRMKFGVDADEQQREVLQSREVRAAMSAAQQQQAPPADADAGGKAGAAARPAKRERSELDDLLSIRL
jgi:RNA processing factor Prp31